MAELAPTAAMKRGVQDGSEFQAFSLRIPPRIYAYSLWQDHAVKNCDDWKCM